MDENVARTQIALSLMVALIDQLKKNGTLTDQDLDDLLAMAPSVGRVINPSFNDHQGVADGIELVRKALR
jgi:hypothetical protein